MKPNYYSIYIQTASDADLDKVIEDMALYAPLTPIDQSLLKAITVERSKRIHMAELKSKLIKMQSELKEMEKITNLFIHNNGDSNGGSV